ncbi:tetratricopeptide repeat protein [Halomicronema hongdechloris C2206]|uniref:Tetratricopeptide repeat protein n=1 Tax=Halomicronema hongdechloris C2206 TaxID=1641165 RepID=A0A1Z3HP22_9CYAN|nr:HEAT repeat domain-containing protein [Halomicronema hongdechloris]ASC72026.1 tetratricopeptide repeat protein [Halomicronema hongdechloris C2206]
MSGDSELRSHLFRQLSALPQPQFEEFLVALNLPPGIISGPSAPQGNRVADLLNWATGSTGCGLDPLTDLLEQRFAPKAIQRSDHIDFEPYLQSIRNHEDYRERQEVYTRTTVAGRKQVPRPKFSPLLKLRVETVKPQEDREGRDRVETVKPQEDREGRDVERIENREQVEQWDVLAGLRNYAAEHVLLIGKPGSGKSTSLERLLWEEASNALQNPAAKIPVLVKLRRCTSTLEHLIQDYFSGHELPLEIAEIERLLRQGRLLLLLDGLNELPEDYRTEVTNFRDRNRATTPMIVSTRDLSVGGTLGITKTLKMLPLTAPQMQAFVRGYLREEGDRLFQQLQGDRLRKFAETPLLLWMLCRVFAQNGEVPANLGLAFREFTQLYDQGTEEHQAIQEDAPVDSRKQWPKLLRHLAFALMHDQDPVEFRLSMPREEAEAVLADCLQQEGRANARACAERWLQDLLDYHLLQPVKQPTLEEHIEFRHQLIQEYYAAEQLLRLLPELSDDRLKRDYLNLLKWTEPVALMLALVNEEEQALRVVKLAIDDVDLMLGAKLAGEVKPSFQEQTVQLITGCKENPLQLKVKLLDKARSASAIPALKKILEEGDDHFINQSWLEKLPILRKKCRNRNTPIEENLSKQRLERNIIRALANTSSEEAIKILAKYSTISLGKLGSSLAIPHLLKLSQRKHEIHTRREAATALLMLNAEIGVPSLIDFLEDYDKDIFDGLDDLDLIWGTNASISNLIRPLDIENHVSKFLNLLKSQNFSARFNAAQILAIFDKQEAIPVLSEFITNADPDSYGWNYAKKRRSILFELASLGCKEIIPELFRDVKESIHSDSNLEESEFGFTKVSLDSSKEIFYSLEKLKSDPGLKSAIVLVHYLRSEKTISGLIHLSKHEDAIVRIRAVLALGYLDSGESISALSQALNDSQDEVVKAAANSLARLGTNNAVQELKKSIESGLRITDKHRACLVISSLSKLDPVHAIPILKTIFLDALERQEIKVQACVTYTLDKFNSEGAIPLLQRAIKSQYPDVRKFAAFGLGNLGCEEAFSELLITLKERDWSLREMAANALVKLTSQVKNDKIIPALVKAVKDSRKNKNTSLYRDSIQALDNLDCEKALLKLRYILAKEIDPYRRIKATEVLGDLSIKLDSRSDIKRATEALLDELRQGLKMRRNPYAGIYEHTDRYRKCCDALKKVGFPIAIAELWRICQRMDNISLISTIAAIQNRCKFYNYEIWQEAIQTAKLEIQNEGQIAPGQTTYVFPNATEAKTSGGLIATMSIPQTPIHSR